jgi:hypothetical protein
MMQLTTGGTVAGEGWTGAGAIAGFAAAGERAA